MRLRGMKLALMCFWMLMFGALQASAQAFSVVEDGKAQCVIAVDGASSHVLKLAGDELQKWVAELTGAKLDIVAAVPSGKASIALKISDDIKELAGNDGYAIRRKPNEFAIIGSCPKGVLNGVFKVLYNNANIIWARPEAEIGTIYRKNSTLSFAEKDLCDVPVFIQRGWQMETRNQAEDNAFWLTHNCANWMTNRTMAQKHGCILEFGGGHNLNGLYIPESKYFKEHPDYYPMVDGKRQPPSAFHNNTQLCFTNDEMTAEFIRRLDEFVSKNMQFSVFRVMLEDNYNLCTCPKCMEPIRLEDGTVLDGHGLKVQSREWKVWRSTQFFIWYNKLAKFMAEKYPDKRLLSFAYFFTEYAPKIKVMDNVDISFCPIYRDSKFTILDNHNKIVLDTVSEWLDMTPHVTWREYYGLNVEYPRPIDRMAFTDMAYLSGRGVRKTYSELVADSPVKHRWRGDKVWDLSAPYLWSLVQAPWNPNRKVEDVRKEYFTRVFGTECAPEMEAFYAKIEDAWYKSPGKSVWSDKARQLWRVCFLKAGIEEECLAHLATALTLVDNPKAREMIVRIQNYLNGDNVARPAAQVSIPKAKAEVTFTPGFNCGAWDNALTLTEFFTEAGKPSPHPTTVKLIHDGKNIYCAMHAERKGIAAMMDKTKTYCQTEVLDLHFQLTDDPRLPDYVHIMVDPLNRSYVSAEGNRQLKGFKWNRKVELGENAWDVMISMPLDQLPKTHKIAPFRRYNNNDKSGVWPNGGVGLKNTTMHAVETYAPFTLE